MAKHVYKWVPERKLLTEALTTENIEKAAPRLHTFHEGVRELKSLQSEISQLGKYTRRNGFTPDKTFQKVATIPVSVKAAIIEVMPDAFEDKEKFYALLNNDGPLSPYDVRGKITI
jgi:hypothetical protein